MIVYKKIWLHININMRCRLIYIYLYVYTDAYKMPIFMNSMNEEVSYF